MVRLLGQNKHLFSNQSGFRALHSVVICLHSNKNDWYVNMDNERYTLQIFLSISKAFGTVDHDILLAKLRKYGVDNLEYACFLTNRIQSCEVNRFLQN